MTAVSREEWLEVRRSGIGSSDAAAVCGLDPWRSPMTVYLDKIGELDDVDSDAMRWGRRLESAVAAEYRDRHIDIHVVDPDQSPVRSVRWPWMLASPDRLLHDADGRLVGLLEIKTSSARDLWDDGVPDHYQVQVQHQLAVCDAARAEVAVLIGGRDYREYELVRDDGLIGELAAIEEEFWGRVLERRPPPVDGTEACTEALARYYRRAETIAIDLPDHAAQLLTDLAAAKSVRDTAEEDVRLVENELRALLGPATEGRIAGQVAVTWRPVETRRLDTKALRAAHPDLAATHETVTTSRRLVVKKGDWT